MVFILICYILLSLQFSDSASISQDLKSDSTFPNKTQSELFQNKIPIISEGGPIMGNNTLLKENHTNLINLEKEFGKDKGKPVVPRKGVDYIPKQEKESTENDNVVDKNMSKIINSTFESNIPTDLVTQSIFSNYSNSFNDSVKSVTKPHILSYEALSQMDKINNIIFSDNEPNLKVHILNTSSHPGMIMPIVITILVVPMFAVVGYMALKRGKEAWKNRHYKRMDFLLDGMYND